MTSKDIIVILAVGMGKLSISFGNSKKRCTETFELRGMENWYRHIYKHVNPFKFIRI